MRASITLLLTSGMLLTSNLHATILMADSFDTTASGEVPGWVKTGDDLFGGVGVESNEQYPTPSNWAYFQTEGSSSAGIYRSIGSAADEGDLVRVAFVLGGRTNDTYNGEFSASLWDGPPGTGQLLTSWTPANPGPGVASPLAYDHVLEQDAADLVVSFDAGPSTTDDFRQAIIDNVVVSMPGESSMEPLIWNADGSPNEPVGGSGPWDTTSLLWDQGGVMVAWENEPAGSAIFDGMPGEVDLAADISAGTVLLNVAGYGIDKNGFNLSIGSLGGDGDATIAGTGLLTLASGLGGYSGEITLGDGTANGGDITLLEAGGALGSGQVTLRGAEIRAGAADLVIANPILLGEGGGRFGGGFNYSLSANISGETPFVKAGEGTVVLSGAMKQMSGPVVVEEGTLRVSAWQALHQAASLSATPGSTLELGATNILVGGHGVPLADSRALDIDNATLLLNTAMDSRIGNVLLRNGAVWTSNRSLAAWDVLLANTDSGPATVTVSGSGPAEMNGSGGIRLQGVQNFDIADTTGDDTPDLVVSMNLAGPGNAGGAAGGLRKLGEGMMVLDGVSTFAGSTFVENGVLELNNNSMSPTTVSDGAVLRLGGFAWLTADLTVGPGGTLQLTDDVFGWSPAPGTTLTAGLPDGESREDGKADIEGFLALDVESVLDIGGGDTASTLAIEGDLELFGGEVRFDLGRTSADPGDSIFVDGELIIDSWDAGTFVFNLMDDVIAAGSYPLITTTEGVWGDPGLIELSGLPDSPRQSFQLSTTSIPGALSLDVSGDGVMLVWNNASGSGLWNQTDANWDNFGVDEVFSDADPVRFEDTANAVENLELEGLLAPGNVVASNSPATDFVLTGSGSIAGSTDITINGGGLLAISNPNAFIGDVIIRNGSRLLLNRADALSADIEIDVAANGILDVGDTAVVTGPVALGPEGHIAGNAGSLDALEITSSGGSVEALLVGAGMWNLVPGTSTTLAATSARSGITNVPANATLRLDEGAEFDGNIALGGLVRGDAGVGTARIAGGEISGGGGLRVDSGILEVAGVHVFSGDTVVENGLLDLVADNGTIYAGGHKGGSVLTIGAGGIVRAARTNWGAANHLGQLAHNSPNNVINGGTLELVGTGSAALARRGWSIGPAGGTVFSPAATEQEWDPNSEPWTQIDLNNTGSTITFDVGGSFILRSTIMDYTGTPGFGGGISMSNGSVVKTGPGVLTLGPLNLIAAENTHRYTGTTRVEEGTLLLNSRLDNSTVIVEAGGTLDLGPLTNEHTASGLVMEAGATFSTTINSDLQAARSITIEGDVDLDGGTLVIADEGSTILAEGTRLTLLSYTGQISGAFADLPEGGVLETGPNTFTIAYNDGGQVTLTAGEGVSPTGGYTEWAAIHAPVGGPGDDYDGDGVANAIEWVLGGGKDTNDLDKLPTIATTDGDFVFTFTRAKASRSPDTTVRIEVGVDLATWPMSFDVDSAPEVVVTSLDTDWEQVTLTLPRDPGTRKFARLAVEID